MIWFPSEHKEMVEELMFEMSEFSAKEAIDILDHVLLKANYS